MEFVEKEEREEEEEQKEKEGGRGGFKVAEVLQCSKKRLEYIYSSVQKMEMEKKEEMEVEMEEEVMNRIDTWLK